MYLTPDEKQPPFVINTIYNFFLGKQTVTSPYFHLNQINFQNSTAEIKTLRPSNSLVSVTLNLIRNVKRFPTKKAWNDQFVTKALVWWTPKKWWCEHNRSTIQFGIICSLSGRSGFICGQTLGGSLLQVIRKCYSFYISNNVWIEIGGFRILIFSGCN